MGDDKKKKNNNNKKPKKYTVDNYDYSRICNNPKCKKEAEVCPKCLERTGKEILGHRREHLKMRKTKHGKMYEETATDIKVAIKIVHTDFALRKGTKIPEPDTGRNVWCKIGERWANKEKETHLTRKLNNDINDNNGVPDYLKDDDD